LQSIYVGQCFSCQQLKGKHQKLAGLTLTPQLVPKWKLDEIAINFVTGLPRAPIEKNAILVIDDHLKKDAHYMPIIRVKDMMDKY
jgi:hypothetical protein